MAHDQGAVALPRLTSGVPEVLEARDVLGQEFGVDQLVADQHVGDAERECRVVGPRPDADPFLRARCGPGESRIYLDKLRTLAPCTARVAEGSERLERGPPGLEQRRPEREHELRALEVVARAARDPVHELQDRVGSVFVVVGHVVP